MPRFLQRASVDLAYLGPEPDRWRSPSEFALKNAQEPDHFIDLERVEWMKPLPAGRYEFYRKLYEKRAGTHPAFAASTIRAAVKQMAGNLPRSTFKL